MSTIFRNRSVSRQTRKCIRHNPWYRFGTRTFTGKLSTGTCLDPKSCTKLDFQELKTKDDDELTLPNDHECLAQSVCLLVTIHAQRDQVRFVVVAAPAPEFQMMYLQLIHRAARLTPPAIAMEDLLPQPLVRRRIQPQARRVGPHRAHDAFSLRPPRNACCCSPGRNLKNLVIEYCSISGFPLSMLAPARKSAQIISKQ